MVGLDSEVKYIYQYEYNQRFRWIYSEIVVYVFFSSFHCNNSKLNESLDFLYVRSSNFGLQSILIQLENDMWVKSGIEACEKNIPDSSDRYQRFWTFTCILHKSECILSTNPNIAIIHQ